MQSNIVIEFILPRLCFAIITCAPFLPLHSQVGEWKLLSSFNQPVVNPYFIDLPGPPRIGFVSGGYRTTDGGLTWSSTNEPSFPYDFAFADSLHGWALASDGVMVTSDGGLNWSWTALNPQTYPSTGFRFNQIARNPITGDLFVTSWFLTAPDLLHSTDGGLTWSSQGPQYSANTGATFDGLIGILITDNGNSTANASWQRSSDGGKTWALTKFAGHSWSPIIIPHSTTILANGDLRDSIYRSDDGGITWLAYPNSGGSTGTLGIGDCNLIYEQGQEYSGYGVRVSSNLGHSWTDLGGPAGSLDSKFFVKENYIYVTGYDSSGMMSQLWCLIRNLQPKVFGDNIVFNSSCADLDTISLVLAPECDSVTLLGVTSSDSLIAILSDFTLPKTIEQGDFVQIPLRFFASHLGQDSCQFKYQFLFRGHLWDTIITYHISVPTEAGTVNLQKRTLDFGSQSLCHPVSIRDSIKLSYSGCGSIMLDSTVLSIWNGSDTDFTFSSIQSLFLKNGDSTHQPISFKPSIVGFERATIYIYSTIDGKQHRDSVSIVGRGDANTRSFVVLSQSISTRMCDSSQANVYLDNTTCSILSLDSLTLPSGLTIQSPLPRTFVQSSRDSITVYFTPQLPGNDTLRVIAHLHIVERGQSTPFDTIISIPVNVDHGIPAVSVPPSLAFGPVSTCAGVTLPVAILNTGCDSLRSVNCGLVSNGVFAITKQPDVAIQAGQGDTVEVSFTPRSLGSFSDTLVILTNAGMVKVPISGTGVADRVSVTLSSTTITPNAIASCTQDSASISLTNGSCKSIVVDSITGITAPFTVRGPVGGDSVSTGTSAIATILYTPQTAGTNTSIVHFYYHDEDGVQHDTTVTLSATASAPPRLSLYLKPGALSERDQQAATIPVYVSGVGSTSSIQSIGLQSFTFRLNLNTDLCTPESVSTSIAGAVASIISVDRKGANITVSVPPSFAPTSETQLVLVTGRTYLTDTMATNISLSNVACNASSSQCFGLDSNAAHIPFTYLPACADPLISHVIGKRPFEVLSITPNPAKNEIIVRLSQTPDPVQGELFDVLGDISVRVEDVRGIPLDVHSLPSSLYYLRLSQGKYYVTKRIVIEK